MFPLYRIGASSVRLGALFLALTAAAAPPPLFEDLFAEADWPACRLESARESGRHPGNYTARLYYAISTQRSGRDARDLLRCITQDRDAPLPVTTAALYTLGRAEWLDGNPDAAFDALHRAFTRAIPPALYHRTGATLWYILAENTDLAAHHPALTLQLESQRHLWSREILRECARPAPPRRRISTAPVRGIIGFYRRQVSPAIGNRCSLDPSCSEYAMQALQRYGLAGVAMIGDRSIREPDVVARREHPVQRNGRRHYADPIHHHYPSVSSQPPR